jgi:hypothetical protein
VRIVERRAVPCRRQPALGAAALLLIFLLGGCRKTDETQSPDTSPALHFVFKTGDRFIDDGWVLNQYGIRVDSTYRRHLQNVVSLQGIVGGVNDAIIIVDSITNVRTGSWILDTLVYRLTPDGGLAQYGFLARMVWKREGRVITNRWDKLYVPGSSAWVVGTLDSAGAGRVSGFLESPPDYFQIVIAGQAQVFPAYRVTLSGPSFDATLWLADSPSSLPRLEEYPEPYAGIFTGSLLILTEKVPAP